MNKLHKTLKHIKTLKLKITGENIIDVKKNDCGTFLINLALIKGASKQIRLKYACRLKQ